jgi:hypothetical protein
MAALKERQAGGEERAGFRRHSSLFAAMKSDGDRSVPLSAVDAAAENCNWGAVELIGIRGPPEAAGHAVEVAAKALAWDVVYAIATGTERPETCERALDAAFRAGRPDVAQAIAQESSSRAVFAHAARLFSKVGKADVDAFFSGRKWDRNTRAVAEWFGMFGSRDASARLVDLAAGAREWGVVARVCAHSPSRANWEYAIGACLGAREWEPIRYAAERSNSMPIESFARKQFQSALPGDVDACASRYSWLAVGAMAKWGPPDTSMRALDALLREKRWAVLSGIGIESSGTDVMPGIARAFSFATERDVRDAVACGDWISASFMGACAEKSLAVLAAASLEGKGQEEYAESIYTSRQDGEDVKRLARSAQVPQKLD